MTVTNINQNARFVLKMPADPDSCASIGPLAGISFCDGNAFSISFNLFLKDGSGGSVIEQADSFTVSLSDSQLLFEARQLGTLRAYLEEGTVSRNEFNCFDITYDNNRLCIYANGFLVKEKNVTGSALTLPNPILLGKEYEGYLSKFKVINYGLSAEEVAQNAYVNTISQNALEICLDFSDAAPKDIGKNKLALRCEGFCIPKNVVDVLVLNAQSAVMPLDHPVLSAEFSVLSKIYLSNGTNPEELIFSYGDYGKEDAFCIGVKNGDAAYAFARIGESEVIMTEPLPAYRWLDLAVSVNGETVSLYLDGTKKAGKSVPTAAIAAGRACIGNGIRSGRIQTMGFSGFIDSVSLFSFALTEAELTRLVSQPPCILSKHVMAVYSFSQKEALDLVSGTMLNFAGAARIETVENTVAANKIPEPEYECTAESTELSDFERWEAATLLDMISTFLKTQHGLMPRYTKRISGRTDYPAPLLEHVVQNILPMEKAQLALSKYQSDDSSHITSLISCIAASGLLGVLAVALFAGSLTTGKTAAGITALQTFARGAGVVLLLAAIGASTAAIISETTDDPPAPPEPKDDKPHIILKSITFNHAPDDCGMTSAINIRYSEDTPLSIPEWTPATKNSYCAYIQSSLTDAVIEVCVQYINNQLKPCTATVTGQADSLLGSFTQTLSFSSPGTKTIKVPLTGNSIKTAAIGEKHVKVNWICSFSGITSFLGISRHTVFLVPEPPLAPYGISASEPDRLLHVNLLSFCGKAFGSNTRKDQILDRLGRYLHSHEKEESQNALTSFGSFLPVQESIYTIRTPAGVSFRSHEYFSALASGSVSISALDAAAIIALMMRANGYACNIAEIKSKLDMIRLKNSSGIVKQVDPVLFTNQVRPLSTGDFQQLIGLTVHYANTNAAAIQYDMPIYDAYYQINLGETGTIALQVLPFSNENTDISMADSSVSYREAFFATGDVVNVDAVITNIVCTPLQEELLKPEELNKAESNELLFGAIGARGNQLIRGAGRLRFDKSVNIPLLPGQHKCHSISYYYIESWIVEIINSLHRGLQPPTHADISNDLRNLITAVFKGVVPPAGVPAFTTYNGANNQVRIITGKLGAQAGTQNMIDLTTAAFNLAYNLNSAIPNLRAGSGDWNSRIQQYFDPRAWVHYDNSNPPVIDNSHSGAPLPAWPAGPIPAPAPPTPNAFYLYDLDDCNQIRLVIDIDSNTASTTTELGVLSELMSDRNPAPPPAVTTHQMIYSSDNTVNLNTLDPIAGGHNVVYYYNTALNTWQLI